MKTIQNLETSIQRVETKDVNSDVEIRWKRTRNGYYYGYMPGKSGSDYRYYFYPQPGKKTYRFLEFLEFEDVKSAKAYARRKEANK